MTDQREVTKQHYDLHAQQQQNLSTSAVLKQRREGPAAPLKHFHNDIKRRLIYRFGFGAEALIDYACGRGGDIRKWHAAKIRYVKGLDISPAEIEEARRRYRELQDEYHGGLELQAEFEQTDNLGLAYHAEARSYDIATCMFAIHYFFDKQDSLKTLLKTIAANLKPGGYFIACVPDGKRVKAVLQANGGVLQKPHLVLKAVSGDYGAFGASYIMEIPDTVVEGHEGLTEGSLEYMVFGSVLQTFATKHGLEPVTNFGDPQLDSMFEEADKDKAFKHFKPSYPASTDASLAKASELYMAFVLRKVDEEHPPEAPPVPPPEERPRPPRQQKQQQGRGHQSKQSSLEWTLPYAAVSLQHTQQMPSVFFNVKKQEHLMHRQTLNRWVIYPPPLPQYSGPVQYVGPDDFHLQPVYTHLPDGSVIHNYRDELMYYRRQQQEEAGHHPQQPWQQGLNGNANGVQQRQQQQQQQPRLPGPPPDPPQQGPGAGGAAGRGRGAGRERSRGASAGRGRGRGPGSRGGKAAAGTKRERSPPMAGADAVDPDISGTQDTAVGDTAQPAAKKQAAAPAAGVPGAGANVEQDGLRGAAAADAAGGAGEEGPPDAAPAAGEQDAAAAPVVSDADKAAARLARMLAADPLGYKDREPHEVPQELMEQLMQHAPPYEAG